MSKTVVISDKLAAMVEERAKRLGFATIDSAVEAFVTESLTANDPLDDHSDGYSVEELRALIDEADASGPAEPWDFAAIRRELLGDDAKRSR